MSIPPYTPPAPAKSRKGLWIVLGLVALLGCCFLAFAGYLGYTAKQMNDEKQTAASSPSAAAAAAGTKYDTAAAVMDVLRAKGVSCEGYKTIPIEQYDERALQSAFCKTADGAELNVSIYANSADARSSVQRLYDKPAQSLYGSVGTVGENWAVHVAYDKRGWIKDVSRALGGSIIEIPPKQ